ncbi:MAG: endolytic transglycosylase MltG [Patescibacteria group bacterium]
MARFLKPIVIIILAVLVIGLFFSRTIYRGFIKNNKQYFPSFIEKLIDRREGRQKPSTISYRPEETIKILEGWTLDDVNKYLISTGKWSKETLEKTYGQSKIDYRRNDNLELPYDFSNQFSFLKDKPNYYSLEGYLFPDTYRIYTDASAKDIVVKMLENFDKKLTDKMRQDIISQGKTIYEIIIMASLIEKEAPIDYNDQDNRSARIVSDIFWGRIKSNQALQSDATLSYLLNDKNASHSGSDLEIDSPYNSYKYRGLPPTPICNPGIKAIEAAIYPIKTDYNYFLTSLDGENIYYARTYEEHLKNKYKYLK